MEELEDNIINIHAVNDRNLHPMQKKVVNHKAASTPLTVGTTASNEVQIPSSAPMQFSPSDQPRNWANDDQEVTQKCPIPDCQWTSFKTTDSSKLDACVKQLLLHVQLEHDMSSSSDAVSSGRNDKTHKEYLAATKLRHVEKTVDDATSNLSDARFFPMPLNLKALGQNMPRNITPVNTVVDMSYVGVDITNAETLRKCHDRTLTSKKLKDFSDSNLRLSHAADDALVAVHTSKDTLKLGKDQKQLGDSKECVRAFYNFLAISLNFHVLDRSPMALLKLVLEKQLTGPPTVEQYSSLFDKFIHESANRAQRRSAPLNYQEILQIWNTFIVPNNMSRSAIEAMIDMRIGRNKSLNPKPQANRGGSGGSPAKKPRINFCEAWNQNSSTPLCSNAPTQGGCLDADGRVLIHSCSYRDKITKILCKSDRHGQKLH